MESETRYESVPDEIRRLIEDLNCNLAAVERQARLGTVNKAVAASIRNSILQSISDLRKIRSG